MEDNRNTGTGNGAPVDTVDMLLPPSPEALVADKYRLDRDNGNRSPLVGMPSGRAGGWSAQRWRLEDDPMFRGSMDRPRVIKVPKALIDLADHGPDAEHGGDYGCDGYLSMLYRQLDAVIAGRMLNGTNQGYENLKDGEQVLDEPLHDIPAFRVVRPPYYKRRTTIEYDGPLGSPVRIKLHLNTGIEPVDNTMHLMLRWSVECVPEGDPEPMMSGWPSGSFTLLDNTVKGRDVGYLLAGIYQAVDMAQALTVMDHDGRRLEAGRKARASGEKDRRAALDAVRGLQCGKNREVRS